jgi:hypothetical protein
MALGAGLSTCWQLVRGFGGRVLLVAAGGATLAFIGSGTIAFGADWLTDRGVAPAHAVAVELARRVHEGDVVLAVDSRSYFPLAYEVAGGARGVALAGPMWYWRGGREPAYFGSNLIAPNLSVSPGSSLRDGHLTIPGLAPGASIWIVALTNGVHELDAFAPLAEGDAVQVERTIVRGTDYSVPIYRLRASSP